MRVDHRRLLNEAPTVVGLMTSVVESGGSLDVAARTVAEDGPPISRSIFTECIRLVDVKRSPSVRDSIIAALGRMPDNASGYRQSLMLCISAADVGDPQERLRILREASDSALDAVRIMGEKYSASLSTPCMLVFGLGIMAPMIMMSILPLMGIGGMFGSMPVDSNVILVSTLVLIPAFILLMAFKIRSDNPFLESDRGVSGISSASPLLLSVPLYLLISAAGNTPEEAMLFAVVSSCAMCLILLVRGRRDETARIRSESGLRDSVFEMGNAMLRGDNFENVSVDVISGRIECSDVGLSLRRELDLCRGDVESAVRRVMEPVSAEVSRTLCYIHRCSLKDTEDAGRLAVAVGRQFQNGSNIRKELEIRLKSMTDMMSGTAVLFAPMVLGMSISMLEPLSEISGYSGLDGTGTMLSVYILELCALISILTSSLGGRGSVREMVWKFCLMSPIALLVFRMCMMFQFRRGLYRGMRCGSMDFRRRAVLVGFAAFGILLALTVAAPFMAPYGSFRMLDGSPGMIDGGWEGHGPVGIIYALGDLFCHQEEWRSYVLNGSQLPFCIRDVGIFMGLSAGFLAAFRLGSRCSDRRLPVLGLVLIAIMVAEWGVETTGPDMPSLRMLTGVLAGLGASLIMAWLLYRDGDIYGQ